ncbi:hypothetical protein EYV94_07915 [Puteibacter caeruleilacunae]|nr:hypothetical protein EYV94_07915 [Puteibacter caeruleilacunae]
MSKKILIVLLAVVAAFGAQAQDKVITIHSVNLTAGVYSPKMDYFNDVYLPNAEATDDFGSSMVFGGNVTFNVLEDFRARVGISAWSNDVSRTASIGLQKVDVSFTRFSLGGFYAPEALSFGDGFQAYAGLEFFYYDINTDIDMMMDNNNATTAELSGNDVAIAPVIGLDKVFGDNILVGAEFALPIGKYEQEDGAAKYDNKITGPQFTISVGYKF